MWVLATTVGYTLLSRIPSTWPTPLFFCWPPLEWSKCWQLRCAAKIALGGILM